MNASDGSRSLAQRRILWWLAETGERPYWLGGRPSWEGGPRPARCPLGLGRPYLPRLSVEALLDEGLLALVDERPPATADNVIALPLPDAVLLRGLLVSKPLRRVPSPRREPVRRIALTTAGRDAAPTQTPYPWRPNVGGADMTFSEEERQRRIAAAAGRPPPPVPGTPFLVPPATVDIPGGRGLRTFGARRS